MTKLNFIPALFTKVTSFTPFPQEHFCQRAAWTHRCLRWPFTLLQFWLRGCDSLYAISQGTAYFCLCAPSVLLFKPLHNFLLGRKPHNILQALGSLTAKPDHFTSTATSALCESRWEREGAQCGEVISPHMWVPDTRWLCPALPTLPSGFPGSVSSPLSPSSVRRTGAWCRGSQEGISTAAGPALTHGLRFVTCQQPEFHSPGVFLTSPHPPLKFPGPGFTRSAPGGLLCLCPTALAQGRAGARPGHRQAAVPRGREGAARQRWGGGRGVRPARRPGTRTSRGSRARPCPAAPAAIRSRPGHLPLLRACGRPPPAKSVPGDAAGGGSSPALRGAPAAFLFRRGWSRSRPAPGAAEDGPGRAERLRAERRGLNPHQRRGLGNGPARGDREPRTTALPPPFTQFLEHFSQEESDASFVATAAVSCGFD